MRSRRRQPPGAVPVLGTENFGRGLFARILLRHILPNLSPVILVQASLSLSTAVLLAALGFNLLGDGLQDRLDPRLRGL
jgi:peptide/nickel transport system permease protein